MVRKFTLQPDLVGLLNGAHRQARQGIARAGSALVVQEPHEAPEGESVIPSVDVVQVIEGVRERLAEMDIRIVDAGQYLPVSTSAPTAADAAPLGAIWRQVDAEGDVVAKWIMTADGWESFTGVVILAENVAASVGVFIDAMMENLTVTGAANINEAAIGELTTRIAEIIRINVEQLYVGRDIRFTSAGLVFYAPPTAGQDPEDWANRVPLISLTPTGAVSVAVAKGGLITAGITPEGTVWGKTGQFDTLAVGGQDILARMNALPRGLLGTTRLSGNVALSTSGRLQIAVRFRWYKDRAYTVQPKLGLSRTTGGIRVRYFLLWGGTGWANQIEIGSDTQEFNGSYTNPLIVQGDDQPTIPDGEEVALALVVDTTVSGATGTMWSAAKPTGGSWLAVYDSGPAVVRWNQPATGDAVPTARDRSGTFPSTAVRTYTSTGVLVLGEGAQEVDGPNNTSRVWYPIDLSALTGSTVLSAKLSFTMAARHPQVTGSTILQIEAATSQTAGRALLAYSSVPGAGGWVHTIPTANLPSLIGKAGILFVPRNPGQPDSWAQLGDSVRLDITYRK